MTQPSINSVQCFLCRRKNSVTKVHKNIETTKCPESRKPLVDVIHHLARIAKTELHIPLGVESAVVCYHCNCQLLEYDTLLVKLLRTQKSLTQMIEKAADSIDSDFEMECTEHMSTMEELNDDHFFDDCDISDTEITQTVNEVVHGLKNETESKKATYNYSSKAYRLGKSNKRKKHERVQCQFCVMRFRDREKLEQHCALAHKKYTCELCDFSHRNMDYVMLHMNLHEGRPENQCRYCEKQFTTKISTIRHMEVHMDSKKYQCDKCGLCFSQTTVLYNHKLQHEAEEEPLKCEICNQVFKTKRTYRHHMITHRADRPRYSCDYCTKTFTEKYTLKVHKRTHGVQISIPEQDPQSAASAAITVVSQPLQEGKYNCIICEQPFPSKDNLNKHMEKEHDVITKSLMLTNFSQYEVITHEPRKPCHICGHMFSTKANLEFHLENVHGVDLK